MKAAQCFIICVKHLKETVDSSEFKNCSCCRRDCTKLDVTVALNRFFQAT